MSYNQEEPRRIIAISTAGVDNVSTTQCNHITVALCNDGSVWAMRDNTSSPRWEKFPSIPQPEEEIRDPACS